MKCLETLAADSPGGGLVHNSNERNEKLFFDDGNDHQSKIGTNYVACMGLIGCRKTPQSCELMKEKDHVILPVSATLRASYLWSW